MGAMVNMVIALCSEVRECAIFRCTFVRTYLAGGCFFKLLCLVM